MATTPATQQQRPVSAMQQIREKIKELEPQFAQYLPPHIPVARFVRVVNTALTLNPKLAACQPESFYIACIQAAQDGLLPDGKEGAIIPYGEDEDGKGRSDIAKWMPMIAGIRKKVRNSGALSDWNVQIVQEGDEFRYQLGDDPHIHHRPAETGGRTRKVLFAYSIATFPDGTKSREVMNADQIEDIRRLSKAKRGPWSNPVFYPEMARKTVARLHSKQLPMSTDLDRLMHRDDDLYNFKGDRERVERQVDRPGSAGKALDWFAGGGDQPKTIENGQPKEIAHDKPAATAAATAQTTTTATDKAAATTVKEETTTAKPAAAEGGTPAQPKSTTSPKNEDEYKEYAIAIVQAAKNAEELQTWFASEAQRKLRNACGVLSDLFNWLRDLVDRRVKELSGDTTTT